MLRPFHREYHFHAVIKIARHEVGTARVKLFLPTIAEIIHAAMFEKTPNNTNNVNVIAHAFDAGLQATHAAHQQIHFYTCLRGFIEQLNKTLVDNGIDLEDEMCLLARLRVFDLASNQLLQADTQIERSNEQFLELMFCRVAGQVVEQISDIRCNHFVAGKKSNI